MSNLVDKVKSFIENQWVVTGETANRIYFKYKDVRGVPKFYFDKKKLEVVRTDKSSISSKRAISVEVHTAIYSLIKDDVEPVTAQEVFNNRHQQYIEDLIALYGESPNSNGGAVVE